MLSGPGLLPRTMSEFVVLGIPGAVLVSEGCAGVLVVRICIFVIRWRYLEWGMFGDS